jgi:hypothetical protein
MVEVRLSPTGMPLFTIADHKIPKLVLLHISDMTIRTVTTGGRKLK